MVKSINDCVALSNGVKMPWLGFGTWKVRKGVENAVGMALKAGYRSIDTAAVYGNEEGVGNAIKDSGILREELFVTSKLWNAAHGYESTLKSYDASLKALKLDYLDLYLIHWPVPSQGKYVESWKAMVKLYDDGLVRAIGVSNFHIHHIEDIVRETGVYPMVNQVELHPLLSQKNLLKYAKENGIQMEAYSPLMSGRLGEVPELAEIADSYGKTPAQLVLRWNIQNKVVVIPKSTNESRIVENASIFDFEISASDMSRIDALNKDRRFFTDPDKMDYR